MTISDFYLVPFVLIGLALVLAVYRHYRTTNVDQLDQLKG